MLRDNKSQLTNIIDGILVCYDNLRNKWLSSSRFKIVFSIDHSTIKFNRWLFLNNVYSNLTSYMFNRNSTLISVSTEIRNPSTCSFLIEDSSGNNLLSITHSNETKKILNNLNIDLLQTEIVRCFINVQKPNSIDYPIVILEYSYQFS